MRSNSDQQTKSSSVRHGVCEICGARTGTPRLRRCRKCAGAARTIRHSLECTHCGASFYPSRQQWAGWRRRGRVYCSPQCGQKAHVAALAGHQVTERTRQLIRQRRLEKPTFTPESRAAGMETKRARGMAGPPVIGGNGRPLPAPQRILAEILGWPTEHAVPTGTWRGSGYPTAYKVDIANPEEMIAVEVDGSSRNSPSGRARDAKKDAFLAGRGWTVLRFSNREVLADPQACADRCLSTTSRSRGPTPMSQTE